MKHVIVGLMMLFVMVTSVNAEVIYQSALVDNVTMNAGGSVDILLNISTSIEPIWFKAPVGTDDATFALGIISMTNENRVMIEYDEQTMELLSIGINRKKKKHEEPDIK